MSNLKPSMIGLDKGLNLQTAKIVAPQGSVLDTLNYEQVDFQGQKRIDGYTRYDGSVLSAVNDYLYLQVGSEESFEFNAGTILSTTDGVFGVIASTAEEENSYLVALLNEKNLPVVNEMVHEATDTDNNATVLVADYGVVYREGDPETHYQDLLDINDSIRQRVEALPGPIAGLHWFRDRLHAIAGVTLLVLNEDSPRIYPTDVLDNGTDTAVVLDSWVYEGKRVVFLDAMVPAEWVAEGTVIYREPDEEVGVASGVYPNIAATREIASIFEARNEQQVLTEDNPGPYDFGWRFIHLGWKVNFTDGNSLYGSLPSINQNIEGIGIQGPTDTSNNNGAAAALLQGIQTSNTDQQVNGWKTTDTPTSYALDAGAIQNSDSRYVYADAYISWDGETGSVVGMTSPPTEYSATATVEVDA